MKKTEDKYQKLTDIEHVLLRPGMYIGSIKPSTVSKWCYVEDKMLFNEITYNPGFIKLFDEIIMNSIDESKRSGTKLKTIKVTISDDKISIYDNGGIDVVIHSKYKQYIPEILFSELKAGSNFSDDEERTGSGTNGVGSSLVNIYSKEFIVSTCDGENKFYQVFSNNMKKRTKPVIEASKTNHTEITYTPDYEKFGLTGLDVVHFNLIKKRVIDLAACNSHIKIYFNDELIKINNFQDYIKLYSESFFFESNKEKTWSIAVAASNEGYKQISFVNSTETYDGGTHVDYILTQIVVQLREFFQKKHKVDIKPSEIKNHIFLFLNTTIINPSFSAQTKEKLITEIKDFGFTYEVSKKLISDILKSEIVESILDWINKKKLAEENKLARDLNKNLSKIKVEKLIDAKSNDRKKCSLALFEGDSASSSWRKYADKQFQGAFSLRGKFVNASEMTYDKLVKNEEVVNFMAAMGLRLGEKVDLNKIRYGQIRIYTDSDHDGHSITGLLINFFFKYWPELFDNNMVSRVETPIVVSINNKSKKKLSFYTNEEYNTWLKKVNPKEWEINFKKGLASLTDGEYSEIIQSPRIINIAYDDSAKESLKTWFGKENLNRKQKLLN